MKISKHREEDEMKKPTILRKRFIPFETVDISSDELLYRDEMLLITKWKAIKPRKDIEGGMSWAFLQEGIKISKFLNSNNEFIYWYCDILDVSYYAEEDKYILTDLLVDVKIMPDGKVIVLDLDELGEALEQDIVTKEQVADSLKKLGKLLDKIYKGEFPPEPCKKSY